MCISSIKGSVTPISLTRPSLRTSRDALGPHQRSEGAAKGGSAASAPPRRGGLPRSPLPSPVRKYSAWVEGRQVTRGERGKDGQGPRWTSGSPREASEGWFCSEKCGAGLASMELLCSRWSRGGTAWACQRLVRIFCSVARSPPVRSPCHPLLLSCWRYSRWRSSSRRSLFADD